MFNLDTTYIAKLRPAYEVDGKIFIDREATPTDVECEICIGAKNRITLIPLNEAYESLEYTFEEFSMLLREEKIRALKN